MWWLGSQVASGSSACICLSVFPVPEHIGIGWPYSIASVHLNSLWLCITAVLPPVFFSKKNAFYTVKRIGLRQSPGKGSSGRMAWEDTQWLQLQISGLQHLACWRSFCRSPREAPVLTAFEQSQRIWKGSDTEEKQLLSKYEMKQENRKLNGCSDCGSPVGHRVREMILKL